MARLEEGPGDYRPSRTRLVARGSRHLFDVTDRHGLALIRIVLFDEAARREFERALSARAEGSE